MLISLSVIRMVAIETMSQQFLKFTNSTGVMSLRSLVSEWRARDVAEFIKAARRTREHVHVCVAPS